MSTGWARLAAPRRAGRRSRARRRRWRRLRRSPSAASASMSRTAVATGASTGSVIDHAGPRSRSTRKAISGGVMPEVHRHRDGAELVGGQERLDELGAVEHQDQHAVAEADTRAGSARRRARSPGGRVHPTSWCGRGTAAPSRRAASARAVPAGWSSSAGAPDTAARSGTAAAVNGWMLPGGSCAALIFDQTWCCPGHTMASAARGQPHASATGEPSERTGEAAAARGAPCAASRCPTRSPGTCGPPSCPGRCCPGTFIRLDETAAAARRQHHAGARGAAHAARRGHGAARAAPRPCRRRR